MRIMQILSGKGVNGAVLQCLALSRALAERGHDVTLACRPGSWLSQQPLPRNMRRVCSSLSRWNLAEIHQMAERARGWGIDILHTHQTRAHVFGLLLRWLTGRPCVATAHALHVQLHWPFNDYVIANSQATFRFHQRWNRVPGRRMEVVNYLLDQSQDSGDSTDAHLHFRSEWGVDTDCPLAGLIGDVIPRKGQLHAVRAWARVKQSLPHSKLAFIGHPKDRQYVQQVRDEAVRLGVADSIVWAGYHPNIPAVMGALDLCVSAAVEEALGLTVLEAMAARRAVVAASVGGITENVWHGETGLLVPPADPIALGQAISQLLSDAPRRLRCGELGWQRVREKYDTQRQLEQVESIYGRLDRRRRESERQARRAEWSWRRVTRSATPSDVAWLTESKLLGGS